MKHDKARCKKCRFHRRMPFNTTVFCNYATVEDKTCLTVQNGKTIDRRGEDFNNCLLFEEGRPTPDQRDKFLY